MTCPYKSFWKLKKFQLKGDFYLLLVWLGACSAFTPHSSWGDCSLCIQMEKLNSTYLIFHITFVFLFSVFFECFLVVAVCDFLFFFLNLLMFCQLACSFACCKKKTTKKSFTSSGSEIKDPCNCLLVRENDERIRRYQSRGRKSMWITETN